MKRILVIDDDVAFTRLLKLNLEATGEFVVQLENWPEQAVATARGFRPDLVLLDVVMPRVFGGDIASSLRSDPDLATVPIVFLTASVRKQRVEEHDGVISGFPFLAKPVSADDVIATINRVLEGPALS
jgi:CheY-like chemotaxis protein